MQTITWGYANGEAEFYPISLCVCERFGGAGGGLHGTGVCHLKVGTRSDLVLEDSLS